MFNGSQVTHHGRGSASQRRSDRGPAWFYVAPGSGVSINVGRSRVMDFGQAEAFMGKHYFNATRGNVVASCSAGKASWTGSVQQIMSSTGLDSLQIVDHYEVFSAERRHEIVMLGLAECEEISRYPRQLLRCGRFPWLDRCDRSPVLDLLSRRPSRRYSPRVQSWLGKRGLFCTNQSFAAARKSWCAKVHSLDTKNEM